MGGFLVFWFKTTWSKTCWPPRNLVEKVIWSKLSIFNQLGFLRGVFCYVVSCFSECVCVCVCVCRYALFLFLVFFWPCHVARGILVPWPGIEPVSPELGTQSLNHWTTREVPRYGLLTCGSIKRPLSPQDSGLPDGHWLVCRGAEVVGAAQRDETYQSTVCWRCLDSPKERKSSAIPRPPCV